MAQQSLFGFRDHTPIELLRAFDPKTVREGILTDEPDPESAVQLVYPLLSIYAQCNQYFEQIDWKTVSNILKAGEIAQFEISDAVSIFPRLTLDSSYELWCYLTGDRYIGRWGKVAAVYIGEDNKGHGSPGLTGTVLHLPTSAAPLMEAIYHDGSPEGYLEAILCTDLLHHILSSDQYEEFIEQPPTSYLENWNISRLLASWGMWYYPSKSESGQSTIIAVRQRIESNYRRFFDESTDRIFACKYQFIRSLDRMHSIDRKDLERQGYKTLLPGTGRYDEQRRCCLFLESRFELAHERP